MVVEAANRAARRHGRSAQTAIESRVAIGRGKVARRVVRIVVRAARAAAGSVVRAMASRLAIVRHGSSDRTATVSLAANGRGGRDLRAVRIAVRAAKAAVGSVADGLASRVDRHPGSSARMVTGARVAIVRGRHALRVVRGAVRAVKVTEDSGANVRANRLVIVRLGGSVRTATGVRVAIGRGGPARRPARIAVRAAKVAGSVVRAMASRLAIVRHGNNVRTATGSRVATGRGSHALRAAKDVARARAAKAAAGSVVRAMASRQAIVRHGNNVRTATASPEATGRGSHALRAARHAVRAAKVVVVGSVVRAMAGRAVSHHGRSNASAIRPGPLVGPRAALMTVPAWSTRPSHRARG
jgi:hypothetical protein